MTVIRNLLGGFVRFISWLCYEHQWTELELSAIAGATVLLLLLVLIRLRKQPIRHIDSGQIHEATPIIGANLAEYNRRRQANRNARSATPVQTSQMQDKPKNWKQMTRQFAKSNEQIRRLQHELAKRKQSESFLEKKVAELRETNKRLNDQIAKGEPATTRFQTQITELTTTIEQLRDEINGYKQKNMSLEQNLAELKSELGQVQSDKAQSETLEKALKSTRLEEPLSIEELKKVSALAKRVTGRV